jgi:hypothetical protein
VTYEESYMKCKTREELEKEIESDIKIAMFINSDRIPFIKRMGEKIANLKFNAQE